MARKTAEEYESSAQKESEDLKTFEKEFDNIEEAMDTEGTYIQNKDDLIKFRDEVNSGNNYDGQKVYLANDIELTEENWIPIGKDENTFNGTFDGKNKKIKNLKGNYDGTSETNVGLFGVVNNAKIKNLTVSGIIEVSGDIQSAGGIIGKINDSANIENCVNEVNITLVKGGYVGGIVGIAFGKSTNINIKNCANRGILDIQNTQTGYYIGGAMASIKNSEAIDLKVDNFINYANIMNKSGGAGGCLGVCPSGGIFYINNIKNLCESITGRDVAGGIVGYSGKNTLVISNSYNSGTITSTSRESGGIIGDTDAISYFINLYNIGKCKSSRGSGRYNRLCMYRWIRNKYTKCI